MGLLVFLLKLGSRRRIGFELDSPRALDNLNRLAGCSQKKLPHSDTLDHFLGHVAPENLAKVRRDMVQRLIRMKCLDHARLLGHFVIVLDGTGQLTFKQRHCEHCLERKRSNGKTLYYHHVLEAKLITPSGLVLSVGTEFIENTDPKATKQDCELKAFARLAPQLKKDFPQLRICLSLDALYANGTVQETCEQYDWKYIIVFKEGSMPAVWREYQTLMNLCPANRKDCLIHRGRADVQQSFAWLEGLQYTDSQRRERKFNAFQCQEQQGSQKGFFAWMTNFPLHADVVEPLANWGGRGRWKIENEGFNIQKNGGFNLEHAYSRENRQIKNYYLLMQIAHLILQLLEKGNLLRRSCKKLFGSLRALATRLSESIRYFLIPPEAMDAPAAGIQIRLDTS
ncbi:MAG: hypothetical protein DRJ50_15785 [Actinobacteria bacterium]|nr:MAG: hypothetical protein DRJ50_15785 [Actinomycetota bacterium]